jgi:hypothetical protein
MVRPIFVRVGDDGVFGTSSQSTSLLLASFSNAQPTPTVLYFPIGVFDGVAAGYEQQPPPLCRLSSH